ncbi:MAG: ABC transporter ATP-binding protein/permease [Pseudomonadota bacterium]
MDWNHELLASIIWLGESFVISLFGLTVTAFGLLRYTTWGRQFKRLAQPYFSLSRSKTPLVMLLFIILLTLFSVRINVLFSFWYNGFYSAMQRLDSQAFWFMLLVFAVLATIHVGRALLNYYLRQVFLIRWRSWLTESLVAQWLEKQAYYRSQFLMADADNPDQRIQQDVDGFVTQSLTLSMGLLDAVVSLFSFTIILWGLSGVLVLFGIEIPRAMVFLVYLYVIIATVFAVKLGRPLISLNFLNEKFNASFRYSLIRVKEYGESIAFYKGESVERGHLLARFANVISNMWAIIYRTLKFDGFNLAISQAAVVFPFVVQAPRLLSKQITLGDMMQTAQAFGQVQDALSFFRSSYDTFASYRAVLNRLTGFLDTIQDVEQLPAVQVNQSQSAVMAESLTVKNPNNGVLIRNLNFSLSQGSAVIIRGQSGVGKTTLLRAIAGLWPYVEGAVRRPLVASLFLPQKPYLPLGSLRTALYYPNAAQPGDVAAEILRKCQLAHLIVNLDEEADWTSRLSLGEQQRLAIGRALLSQAQVVFLDEASSAMDEGLEYAMYQLLRESLPRSILVSVGHRSSLLAFHTQELLLMGQGDWQLRELSK